MFCVQQFFARGVIDVFWAGLFIIVERLIVTNQGWIGLFFLIGVVFRDYYSKKVGKIIDLTPFTTTYYFVVVYVSVGSVTVFDV